jgi:hypothetical protein
VLTVYEFRKKACVESVLGRRLARHLDLVLSMSMVMVAVGRTERMVESEPRCADGVDAHGLAGPVPRRTRTSPRWKRTCSLLDQ